MSTCIFKLLALFLFPFSSDRHSETIRLISDLVYVSSSSELSSPDVGPLSSSSVWFCTRRALLPFLSFDLPWVVEYLLEFGVEDWLFPFGHFDLLCHSLFLQSSFLHLHQNPWAKCPVLSHIWQCLSFFSTFVVSP